MGGHGRIAGEAPPASGSVPAIQAVVRPDHRGSQAVNRAGFLASPAAIRRWCALAAGERVLPVADPVGQVLVVHLPTASDRAVGAAHMAALGGDDA